MRFFAFVVGFVALSFAVAAQAQTVPSPSQVAPRVQPLEATPGARVILPPSSVGGQIPPNADKLKFCLSDFVIEGEFDELKQAREEIAAPLKGRCGLAVAEIYRFAEALQQLYIRAGYILARVAVLPQEVTDRARIRLRIVAGFIEAIDGSALGEPGRSRVLTVVSPLLNNARLTERELQRRLLLAGETPGVVLNATFAPGKKVGGSILVVSGRYKPVSASIYTDNSVPLTFGRWQVATTLSANTLLGLGEQLAVTATGRPDSNTFGDDPTRRYLTAQYAMPIGIDGWRFEVSGTHGVTIPLVAAASATRGTLDQGRLRVSYDFWKARDFELSFAGRFDAADERVESLLTTPPTALSLDRLRVLRGETAGILRLRETGTTINFGATFSRGLPGLGARRAADADILLPLSRAGADAVFSKLEGRLELAQSLPGGFVGTISAFAQTGFGNPLLKSEQMDIVGYHMVSGYDVGTFAGDRTWVTRYELGRPFEVDNKVFAPVLTPYVFYARGERVFEQPTALEQSLIRAENFGVGLRSLSAVGPDGVSFYSFIEYSRQRSTRTLLEGADGNRLLVGGLARY